MKKLIMLAALSAVMVVFSACDGESAADKAQNALEDAQNAVGEAMDSKASQLEGAVEANMDIPDVYGETELPDIDSLTE